MGEGKREGNGEEEGRGGEGRRRQGRGGEEKGGDGKGEEKMQLICSERKHIRSHLGMGRSSTE